MIYFNNSKRIYAVSNFSDCDKHETSVCEIIINNVDAEAFLVQKTEGNNFIVYTGEIVNVNEEAPKTKEVKDDRQKNEKVKQTTNSGGKSGKSGKQSKRSKNRK